MEGHGGDQVAEALRAHGIGHAFTLIGGGIFPVFDALYRRGMGIVDVRHEQSAAFAAEAYGKFARVPGVAVLDQGPGVTNSVNAVVSARFNGTPMTVISGRASASHWGKGSFQELDHIPIFASITKSAETATEPGSIARLASEALSRAAARHRGPTFLDVATEPMFTPVPFEVPLLPAGADDAPDGDLDAATRILAGADRPVALFGSDVWFEGAEKAARALSEALRLPTFMNGQGRGILPGDHALAFNAARSVALKEADVVLVAGAPLDFRLGYGNFGGAAIVHVIDHASVPGAHANPAAAIVGPITSALEALASAATSAGRDAWVARLRGIETEKRAAWADDLRAPGVPIHPIRVYGELVPRLPRDAIVVIDAGDFGSYAGRYIDAFEPGAWLDPGPYGCLGTACGYALAAGTLHPGRRIVVLLGDGAAGFSMGDWDSLIRHGIDVTMVCGNNGTWGLEKAPMRALYGHDVGADLREGVRYDEVMRALGGQGELVTEPDGIGPALERSFATAGPSLVNVLTDPEVYYQRTPKL
jgi:acetolactate synthase-1/2/3 large subunit